MSDTPALAARRRMRTTIMLLLAIALPACPAGAQVSGDELFAGYCLGVFEQRVKEGPARMLGEAAARRQEQILGELYNYLRGRIGANRSRADLWSLSVVKGNGARDQSECLSAIEANLTTQACTRVTEWCKPAPDRVAPLKPPPPPMASQAPQPPAPTASQPAPPAAPMASQLPQPAPMASQPQRRPPPNVLSSQPQSQQRVGPVPALARPEARPPVAPPPAPARQEAVQGAQTRPAGQCTVSRPKPGFQVYRVTCPNSGATIGRTVDVPNGWTISEGVNATEAVEFFLKSPYAR